MTGPLASLNSDKLRLNRVEAVTVSSGQEQVLLDTAGPGYVKSLWMAVAGGNNPYLDGRVRVYYDGASVPTVDIDLGTLLATHWSASGHHLTAEHVHAETDPGQGQTSFLLTFPMPFGQHIRITYYYPSGYSQTAFVFAMAAYSLTSTDEAGGRRLRCSGQRYADQAVSRTIGDTNTVLDTTVARTNQPVISGPGSVVYLGYVAGVNANAFTWLERNWAYYLDGETAPSIETSGTEDTFDSGWYFTGAANTELGRHSFIGTNAPSGEPYCMGMGTDLWSKWGGVPFTQSARLTILTESAVTTGDVFSYCVLYYQ